ncbi:protein of unknown function DUF1189 [Carnobacterium sp. 17-4]|nr:protein of unknown function DUF1189 [Carnobacterium sp. 17-4]
MGIAFLEDSLYFVLPDYPIQLPYTQLNGLTSETFIDLILNVQAFGISLPLITFILIWLSTLFLTFLYTLLYTLFANILSILTGRKLKFGDNWKIVLVASTLPTLFIALLNSVNLIPVFQLEIKTIVTLFIYYLAIRVLPKTKRMP